MKFLFLSLLLSFFAMCSTPKQSGGAVPISLTGTSWTLESFQAPAGKMMAAQNDKANLSFTASGINGHTGCNTMGGDYRQKDNQLTIQAFGTKMYCQEVADQENAINEIMRETMTVTIENEKLVLSRAKGKLIYTKAKAAPKSNNAMGGGAAPKQYDDKPAATGTNQSTAASTKATTASEFTGLFRYMADAAVFTRCSDNQRFAVAMSGNFKEAEAAYTRMNKSGEAALMTLSADIIKNPGEGHPQMLVIQKVLSSSYDTECN